MPISKHFGGHGKEVMADMRKRYGAKKAARVFYATENKRKEGGGMTEHMTGMMRAGKMKKRGR